MSEGGDVARPQVTVLMPVHNAESFVAEAIESILQQTFRDFEFLIIDDGSTDTKCRDHRELQTIRAITLVRNERTPRIRLIRTLNRGLEILARGEFVARMDADDISLPDRLERSRSDFMEANPEVGICGGIGRHDGRTATGVDLALSRKHRGRSAADCSSTQRLHTPAVCFRREIARGDTALQVRRRATPHAEDYELWVRAGEHFASRQSRRDACSFAIASTRGERQPGPSGSAQNATVERIHREATEPDRLCSPTPARARAYTDGSSSGIPAAETPGIARGRGRTWLEKLLHANTEALDVYAEQRTRNALLAQFCGCGPTYQSHSMPE